MAVDTRSRRASVLGITGALLLALPLADGTVGQPDRQHVAFSYAGIAAGAPVAPVVAVDLSPATVEGRSISRIVEGIDVTRISAAASINRIVEGRR